MCGVFPTQTRVFLPFRVVLWLSEMLEVRTGRETEAITQPVINPCYFFHPIPEKHNETFFLSLSRKTLMALPERS